VIFDKVYEVKSVFYLEIQNYNIKILLLATYNVIENIGIKVHLLLTKSHQFILILETNG